MLVTCLIHKGRTWIFPLVIRKETLQATRDVVQVVRFPGPGLSCLYCFLSHCWHVQHTKFHITVLNIQQIKHLVIGKRLDATKLVVLLPHLAGCTSTALLKRQYGNHHQELLCSAWLTAVLLHSLWMSPLMTLACHKWHQRATPLRHQPFSSPHQLAMG